jgi:hypothetical protein
MVLELWQGPNPADAFEEELVMEVEEELDQKRQGEHQEEGCSADEL